MKTSELAAPEQLRVQRASDEAFRILTGSEPDQSAAEPAELAELAELQGHSPIIEQAVRILSGDESDRPAEANVGAAEIGHTPSSGAASDGGPRLPIGDENDISAGERLIDSQSDQSSLEDTVAPFVPSRHRFGVFAIVTATIVSFGAGVLAPQLFLDAGDDPATTSNIADAATLLKRERQRTGQLTTELAAARHDFEAQLKFTSDAVREVTQLKKSVEAVTAELGLERQKNAELTQHLQSVQSSIEPCDTPDCVAKNQRRPAVGPGDSTSTPEVKIDPELVRLLTRANELLAQGNISGARSVLERAVEMGSARASFMIAETYDPGILAGWKTFGTRGDPAKAREFYAKAAAGGIEEAKGRLAKLAQK
jgi:hypothetical protein